MRRRDFIRLVAGSAAAWPLATRAQQGERIRRIGVLIGATEDDPETKAGLSAFRQGLEKRGWSEGRNVHIAIHFVGGDANKYGPLAKQLVIAQPDVILAQTTPVAAALQRETRQIPTVFVNVSDPIGSGFVASLARPGGNFTGVLLYEGSVVGKWLAMLKEMAPRLERVAFVANPKISPVYDYFLRAAEAAAASLGLKVVPTPVSSVTDIKRAIDAFASAPNGGLLLPPDTTTRAHRDLIIALAAQYRLPAVYPLHLFVAAGGLMSYGTDQDNMFRLAAFYVDRILRGDKPAELPVQAPTKFETTLNLRTAKALGLTFPPGLLVAADEVIE